MSDAPTIQIKKRGVRRLLLISADEQDRVILLDVLQSEACQIVFLDSTAHLEDFLLKDVPFDAILMELFNPVEAFFDLISIVKTACPHTEVILVSRLVDEDLWIESIQRGAYDLISKPLDGKELKRIVTNAVERNRPA